MKMLVASVSRVEGAIKAAALVQDHGNGDRNAV